MIEKVSWHIVRSEFNSKMVLATIGVTGDDQLVCVAYHYDFRDYDFDKKVSLGEGVMGHFGFSNRSQVDVAIGNALIDICDNPSIGVQKIHNAQIGHIFNTFKSVNNVIKFATFQAVVGTSVNVALTQAGITGIKKFIYAQAFKQLLGRLV